MTSRLWIVDSDRNRLGCVVGAVIYDHRNNQIGNIDNNRFNTASVESQSVLSNNYGELIDGYLVCNDGTRLRLVDYDNPDPEE